MKFLRPILFVLLGAPSVAHAQNDAFFEKAIRWMPEDIETLAAANGPITRGIPVDEEEEPPTTFDKIFEGYVAWPLLVPGGVKDAFVGLAKENPVKAVLVGGRNFGTGIDIGLSPYQGAHCFRFSGPIKPALAELEIKGAKREKLGDMEVTAVPLSMEQNEWTLYLAQPEPDILIVATHEGFLGEMAARMKVRPAGRALPEKLPEWQHVDRKARYWAARHYRNPPRPGDPTNPLSELGMGPMFDGGVIGIATSYTPPAEGRDVAVLHYLTANPDAVAFLKKNWVMEDQFVPEIARKDKHRVEIEVDLTKEYYAQTLSFYLFVLLGFSVAV